MIYKTADFKYLNNFYEELELNKYADGGILQSIVNYFKNVANTKWEEIKKDPINEMLSFLAIGTVQMLFGTKIAILMSIVTEVFGINFSSVLKNLKDALSKTLSVKPDGSVATSLDEAAIDNMVKAEMEKSFNNVSPNEEKLEKLAPTLQSLKASSDGKVLEKYGFFGISGAITAGKGIFSRVFGYLIKALLMGFGVSFGTASATSLVDLHKSQTGGSPIDGSSINSKPQVQLKLGPNANKYEEWMPNDNNHIWFLDSSMQDLPNNLIKWTIDIYPQFEKDTQQILNNSNFQATINKFKSRNPGGLSKSLAVPSEWNSKKEIVDSFAPSIK